MGIRLCGSKKVTDAVTHSPIRMLDMLTVPSQEKNTLGSPEDHKVELKPENEWQLSKIWLEIIISGSRNYIPAGKLK